MPKAVSTCEPDASSTPCSVNMTQIWRRTLEAAAEVSFRPPLLRVSVGMLAEIGENA